MLLILDVKSLNHAPIVAVYENTNDCRGHQLNKKSIGI